jgi:hypothetical protein
MSEQYNPQIDNRLLDYIDSLVAGRLDGAPGEPDATSPTSEARDDTGDIYGFAAHLAGTVPQADEGFRNDLLGKLLSSLDAGAENVQPHSAPQAGKSETQALADRQSRPIRAAASPREGKVARRGLLGGWWGVGRAGSYAAAVAALAFMGLVLVGLAFMLGSRQNKGLAGNTPVATATGSATADASRYTGIAPRQAYEVARVQEMAWSPDGSMVATAYGSTMELWEAASGRFLHSATVREVRKLAWSPDSRTLAVDSAGSSARLIEAATGEERVTLHFAEPKEDSEYGGGVNLLAFAWSPDSKVFATHFASIPGSGLSSPSGVIGLWDGATGKALRSISVVPTETQEWNLQDGRYKLVWSPWVARV